MVRQGLNLLLEDCRNGRYRTGMGPRGDDTRAGGKKKKEKKKAVKTMILTGWISSAMFSLYDAVPVLEYS